jgi:isoquinoline 1-oxidoreductase subunit beta
MLNRREFLKKSAFAAGFAIMENGSFSLLFGQELADTSKTKPFIWFDFDKDGSLTLYSNKCEMGQGIFTGFAQIVADELEYPFEKIMVVSAPAEDNYVDPVWKRQATGGSTGIRHMFTPLRQAAAMVRESIRQRAAQILKVDTALCQAKQGYVICLKTGKKLSYAEIVTKTVNFEPRKDVKLKDEKDFTYIGKSMPRVDTAQKISAKAIYAADIIVPNMLYAAIIPHKAYGAKALSVDDTAAKKIKGFIKTFSIKQGVAVIANSTQAAFEAKSLVKVAFTEGEDKTFSTANYESKLHELLKNDGVIAKQKGEINTSHSFISSTFSLPYLYHATIEPLCAVADVNESSVAIWVGTQGQSSAKSVAAKEAGIDESKVSIHTTYLGGGFGRKSYPDVVQAVVEISKKIKAPVKLQYEREDDLRFGRFRPATVSNIQASIGVNGMISAWKHKIVAVSVFEHASFGSEIKIDPAAVEGLTDFPYETDALLVNYVKTDSLAPVHFWRSVGSTHNAYTVECFMDELAAAAKADPLDFRLRHLKNNERAQKVLKLAGEKIGWSNKGAKGLGIAYHYCFGSHAVQAVQISVDKKSGHIYVEKVVSVLDIGPLNINPDILRAQVEGCVIMGISAALNEKLEFAQGAVSSSNFGDYPILRCSQTPKSIEVYTIKSDSPMGGVGEPPLPPMAPAIANAFFALTGKMPKRLPLTQDEVKRLLT